MRTHLGIYSDWVEAAKKQADLYPAASPGEETSCGCCRDDDDLFGVRLSCGAAHLDVLYSGLATIADWPDLVASRAPSPLLVQYDRDDQLFPLQGMQSAHARIASH